MHGCHFASYHLPTSVSHIHLAACELIYRGGPSGVSAVGPAVALGTMEAAARRMQAVLGHLDPPSSNAATQTAAWAAEADPPQSTASAAPQPTSARHGISGSSYVRVHGEVSRDPPRWSDIASVAQHQLQEVAYQKAEGDGIARVRLQALSHARPTSRARMSSKGFRDSQARMTCLRIDPLPSCRSPSIGRTGAMPSRR